MIKRHDSVSVPSKRAAKRKYKRKRTKRNSEKKAEGARDGWRHYHYADGMIERS